MSKTSLIVDHRMAQIAFAQSRNDIVDRLETDWILYSPYAESVFVNRFNTILKKLSTLIDNKPLWIQCSDELVNLWWEMHVGTHLLRAGFTLKPNNEKPLRKNSPNLDHLIITPDEKRVWVECTQAARGPISRELPGFDIEGGGCLPLEDMMLRGTNSLNEKASTKKSDSQINRFKAAYPDFSDDCYIVALGTGNLPNDDGDRFSPSVAFNAVFGVGNPTWTVNKDGSNCNFQGVEKKDMVLKKTDSPINTAGFLDGTYSTIAGLLVSCTTPFLDADMCGIANPTAEVPLPTQLQDWIPTWSFDIENQTILRPPQFN